jgi:hypothetical protein
LVTEHRDGGAVLKLFVYRYYNPAYRQWTTLDCAAETVEEARQSAERFVRRRNRWMRRAGVKWRIQIPSHVSFMKQEG